MTYNLLPYTDATRIRTNFENAFIMPNREFETKYCDLISFSFEQWKRYDKDAVRPTADSFDYWDRLIDETKQISFEDALSFLTNIKHSIYFLSDKCSTNGNLNLLNNDKDSVGFVAFVDDSNELVKLIYDEWYQICNYDENNDEWIEPSLPWNLFVFDDSFKWMIFFSHHDDYEDERKCEDCENHTVEPQRYCCLIGE